MKNLPIRPPAHLLPLLVASVLLAACTHVYQMPEQPVTGYAAGAPIPLAVELRLSEEFRTADWRDSLLGETYVMPLGPALTKNAKALARKLFRSARITNSATAPTPPGVAATLTPRVALVERRMGATAFGDQVVTVKIEWTLRDPSGNVIWIDTVRGEGRGHTGNLFTHMQNTKEQIAQVFDQLFRNAAEVIATSPEIRAFAAAH